MSESIHGHQVMQMMLESSTTYTQHSLKSAMVERFGANAVFHTCKMKNMDADALIEFLTHKGKFVETEGGFTTHSDKICSH
ncbi:YecH family metal-binding protein [Echinimonas agarilytica]|uniref:YecH family protein n=1 Tax=Echinimonas agarilytica TaxID=1215918 RepID=A0AA42B8T0_9GAMM|nr:YecH family metal-binding protein [Echinimonas agarilytica]MCM2681370.1 YecH family protein [Echinimonas agarilytica]